MCGTIYLITCLIDGKRYVGKTKLKPEQRFRRHILNAASGVDTYLYNAMRLHGCENFVLEIIQAEVPIEQLNEFERKAILQLNTIVPNGYNLTAGGDGLFQPSEETRRKMSEAHLGKAVSPEVRERLLSYARGNKFCVGKTLSDEHKKKISEANKGRKRSQETREKISKAKKGVKKSNKEVERLRELHKGNSYRKGATHTEEAKEKISKAFKGKPWSPARRAAQEKLKQEKATD